MHTLFAQGVEKAWGNHLILRDVSMGVSPGDRVGLVGPNGCGKSTFLSILAGREPHDGGRVVTDGRVVFLPQIPELGQGTVDDAMKLATAWHADLLARWQQALDSGDDRAAAALQDELDLKGWEIGHEVDAMLDRLAAPGREQPVSGLSGGERRRVALARALLQRPDVLLLDEPTNHLDAETVDWLQAWMENYSGALVLVTHDRYLLEAVATRIVEIEDGVAVPYEGSYADYLIARAERQAALQRAEDRRLAMIRQEAEWASRSPAARSTKQRARLDRLEVLRDQRPLKAQETFSLEFETGLKMGQTLLEAHGLSKGFGERVLFEDLDLTLLRGERIGVVGPNGAGKSTLMKVLCGLLERDKGTLSISPRVTVGLLDQHRTGLTLTDTVFEAAGGGNDRVEIRGHWVHVAGFLQRFLFKRQVFDQQVGALSGGERARLLMARLMLQGANLLLLDEPTNDLDLMTLRVLEEALLAFDGSALIVTHDRAFLDRACTSILHLRGDGGVTRYASRQQLQAAEQARAAQEVEQRAAVRRAQEQKSPPPERKRRDRKRLSFNETRELEGLPDALEALEQAVEDLEGRLSDPATYRDPNVDPAALTAQLEALQTQVTEGWARWEALSERAEG